MDTRDEEDVVLENTPTEESTPVPPSFPRVSPVPVLPQLSVALGLLVFVFGVTYIGASKQMTAEQVPDVRVETLPTPVSKSVAHVESAFDDIRIGAEGAIVWDITTQRVIFNKNADEQFPLASITKLMTALVAYELLNPDDSVFISQRSLLESGDSGFIDGEEFTVQNLMDLTLISSSNDGAFALGARAGEAITTSDSESAFVTAMNLRAEELGLDNTIFKNTTGLDISATTPGAYGSARDVAHLMEYMLLNASDVVIQTSQESTQVINEDGAAHLAHNTNTDVHDIQGLIASKTGYTPLAGGNLVIAFNAGLNRPVVVVVLGSTPSGRFEDVRALVTETRKYIENENK